MENFLTIPLPNRIGIIENVWGHITLENDKYIPIHGIFSYHYHSPNGLEWPKIFYNHSKQEIFIRNDIIDNTFNSSIFCFPIDCPNCKGFYVCTFTIGKITYYTETRDFSFQNFNSKPP